MTNFVQSKLHYHGQHLAYMRLISASWNYCFTRCCFPYFGHAQVAQQDSERAKYVVDKARQEKVCTMLNDGMLPQENASELSIIMSGEGRVMYSAVGVFR